MNEPQSSRPANKNDVTSYEDNDCSKSHAPVSVQFEDLAQGENEILIQFQDKTYRLKVTRNGGLILNK